MRITEPETNPFKLLSSVIIFAIMIFAIYFMLSKGHEYNVRYEDHVQPRIVSTN